ncbi:MAG: DUF2202 domain-containing protein [Sulfurovum sp.]|nr:DUF2202 domain-containing protein [Sulfurovum sp.]
MTLKHFAYILTVFSLLGCGSSDSTDVGTALTSSDTTNETIVNTNDETVTLPANVEEAIAAPLSTLTQDLQDSITYMYSEEGLAHDLYLNIYEFQALNQLKNIATKSEVKHIAAVNQIAQKYDLNITKYPDTDKPYSTNDLERYGSGEYPVEPIQELYNILYDKGILSARDALEVGCLVEVVDIDDLDEYIEQAEDANASDVLEVFNFLREGSYAHYWTFDEALKNMNVTDGCCSLDDFGEHDLCHPEYPIK